MIITRESSTHWKSSYRYYQFELQLRAMDDPREHAEADLYDNVTSDSDDEREIQQRLEEIEAQKNDLKRRLKEKKERSRILDPNFVGVQIPNSPEKQRRKKEISSDPVKINPKRLFNAQFQEQSGENEQKLLEKLRPNNDSQTREDKLIHSPTYFLEKFQKAKQNEKAKIQEHQQMMSRRVHAFDHTMEGKSFPTVAVEEIDPFSNLWVKKRYLPKEDLQNIFQDVKILRLSKLFAKVRPPKFTEPQYSNWATVGIISKKEDVKFTSAAKPQKYFKFTLTDFKHNLDVYIFGNKGVEKYYNLRIGDIIAVLNPEILPWRPSGKEQFIKSFNLRIAHGFNCILEFAQSRDIGWCHEIIRSKNQPCNTPINTSTDRCCEYHREIQFRKTNSQRVDLTGNYAMGAPTKSENQPVLYRSKGTFQGARPSSKQYNILPSWSQQNPQFYDKYGGKSRHFSTSKAAHAFFDEKYQNPDMLQNLDSKRRKITDEKKDSAVNQVLDRLLQKNTNMVEGMSNQKRAKKIKDSTQNVLQGGLIQRLGFDPTHGKMATVLNHNNKTNKGCDEEESSVSNNLSKKDKGIKDLVNFKKEKIVLKPSRVALMNRKNHRETVWKQTFDSKTQSPTEKNAEDSDSDLDII